MILEFDLRPSYGENRYYPTNEAARLITENLVGRTCLRDLDLILLATAGAELVIDGERSVVSPLLERPRPAIGKISGRGRK